MTKTMREEKPNNSNDWEGRWKTKLLELVIENREFNQFDGLKPLEDFIEKLLFSELQSVFEEMLKESKEMIRNAPDYESQQRAEDIYYFVDSFHQKYLGKESK